MRLSATNVKAVALFLAFCYVIRTEATGSAAASRATARNGQFVIARHSQNTTVPSCPNGYTKLWDGYSLMSLQHTYKSNSQDLGDAGSCLRKFSQIPFLYCYSGTCRYASTQSSGDESYWLATAEEPDSSIFSGGPEGADVEPFISRCSVCSGRSPAIAVHSQTALTPACPSGFGRALWSGYSFALHLEDLRQVGQGGGPSLSSPGSCLQQFSARVFTKCRVSRGCEQNSDMVGGWLATIDNDFQVPVETGLKNDEAVSRVSRCQVCTMET